MCRIVEKTDKCVLPKQANIRKMTILTINSRL